MKKNTTWMRPLLALALFGVWGCPPSEEQPPDEPVADMSEEVDQGMDADDMDKRDLGETDPDMGPVDMSGDDMAEPGAFEFLGVRAVTPVRHDADAPAEALIDLELEGELPEGADVTLEVDGEQVELTEDFRFTPPARPGAPGPRTVSVTIDGVTHVLPDALRYFIDARDGALSVNADVAPGSMHRSFPEADQVVGAWKLEGSDGQSEWLIHDRSSGERAPMMSTARLVHVREDEMGTLTVMGKAALPAGAEFVRPPMPFDVDRDGVDETISALVMAPGEQGKGASLFVARLNKEGLSGFEALTTFEESEQLLDSTIVELADPDTGAAITQLVSLLVSGSPDKREVIFHTTYPTVQTSSLGLPEYDPMLLEDGTEQVRLVLDESSEPGAIEGFIVGVDVDVASGSSQVLYAPATSHNASRSNRSSGIAMPGGGDCDDDDPVVLPGFDARIMDHDGDGVGDLIVGAGCPGESAIHIAPGKVLGEGDDAFRDFSKPVVLTREQSSSSAIHSLRVDNGVLTGMAAPVCSDSLCSLPSVFAVPVDRIGAGSGLGDIVQVQAAPATSHNASRSNRSQGGIAHPGGGEDGADIDLEMLSHRLLPGRGAVGATGSSPIPSRDGTSYWVPAEDGLTQTVSGVSHEAETFTSLKQLRDVISVDSVMTAEGRLILASLRGPVTLRSREEVERSGGALLEQEPPRVFAMRCAHADDEQRDATWSDEMCPGGFEVTELTPPEECFWDGHVTLYRVGDSTSNAYTEARVGIRLEEYKKTKLYRFHDGKPLAELESRPGKHFPATRSLIWGEGRRVFTIDDAGEVLTGEVSGEDDAAKEVEMTSTALLETIRTNEGQGASITRTFSICLEGRGSVLGANVRDEQGRGHVYFWVPGGDAGVVSKAANEDHIGNFNWSVEIEGVMRDVSSDGGGMYCGKTDHFMIAGGGDEGYAILDAYLSLDEDGKLATHTNPLFQEASEETPSPLYEGAIPDDHDCAGQETCPQLIESVGDFDGDGLIDMVLPGKDGPMLYSRATTGAPSSVGPIRWMAPESLRAFSGTSTSGSSAQALRREDGSVVVLPPLVVYWNGAAIPSSR